MDKLKRFAIVLSVIENLHRFESWSGETHIQKTVYFLEKAFPEVIDFYPFILYKYGPFSFELRDDLGIMSAEKFIKITPRFPYGLRIFPEKDFSEEIKKLFPKTLAKNEDKIIFITSKLATKCIFRHRSTTHSVFDRPIIPLNLDHPFRISRPPV